MAKWKSILVLLTFVTCAAFGQEPRFTVSANKIQVATGEQFEISFTVNGNGERFTPPDLSAFDVLSGPNVSSSMTVINGNASSSIGMSYDLAAVKEGVFTIGPAAITINGKKLVSNTITVKVVKGRPGQQNASRQQSAQPDQPEEATEDLSKSLFIRAVVDKADVYQGEQLTLSFKLYTRVGLDGSQLDKVPDLTGFWTEELKTGNEGAQWRVETYKGLRYNVADIKQSVLFPEHSGNIVISPLEMTLVARQPAASRDIMEEFFGGSYKQVQVKVKSAPVTIHVKPLPETGKPAGFAGAVGSFSVKAEVDRQELKANEALNYTVNISGSGNLKLLKTPEISFPPEFEKYDPKVTDNITETINGVSGTRKYVFLTVPREEGKFTIEPLQFSFFNPSLGKYITVSTAACNIKVNKGDHQENASAFAGSDKQDVKLLGNDIRYIKTGDPGISKQGEGFYGSILYYLLLAIGPVVAAGAWMYRRKERENNSDLVQLKSRKAGKIAAKHLAIARQELVAGKSAEFYDALFKGLYGYLSDKLNIPYAKLDKEVIIHTLKARAVAEEVTARLTDTLNLCEMARYAPVTGISKQEVLEKATGIIGDIESNGV